MFKFGVPAEGRLVLAKQIRDNFESLAVHHITSNEDEPINPKDGMIRALKAEDHGTVILQLYFNERWRFLAFLQEEATPANRKEQAFTGEQWVFDHNLGHYPLVQCMDNFNEVVQPFKIVHASVNRVIAIHSQSITGRMIVIG